MRFLHDLLDFDNTESTDKIAVLTALESIRYSDLRTRVLLLADFLGGIGVSKGDRVLILLPNCLATIITIFAASKLGAIFVCISEGIVLTNLDYIINDCSPKAIITNNKRIIQYNMRSRYSCLILDSEKLEGTLEKRSLENNIEAQISPNEPVCLIYTSGSTGRPKAVVSTHNNILFSISSIQKCIAVQNDDTVGLFLPMSFDYGLYQTFLAFQVKASLALCNAREVGTQIINQIIEFGVTGLPIVPSMVGFIDTLRKRKGNAKYKLRFITSTGSKLSPSQIHTLMDIFPQAKIYSMYGLTECKRVSILPSEDIYRKINSIGKPLPDTQCFIVDENGIALPSNTTGQLLVSGPNVMEGYWNDPSLTNQVYGVWNNIRVLFTGDLCSIDEEGYLYFHGRRDETYKKKGFRISAYEIEQAAQSVLGIDDAVLIHYDGHFYLFVISDHPEEYVRNELAKKLEDYKIPDRVIMKPAFPLNINGKIDKYSLKANLEIEGNKVNGL